MTLFPLRHREPGSSASGLDRRSARGTRPRAAPREDEDCVLQRREPPKRLGAHQLRLPRLHLPGSPDPRPEGLVRELLPSHERQSEEGDRPEDQSLASQPSQRNGPSQPRRGNQPPGTRLDQLLRAFYRSELHSLALRIDQHLVRWAMQKFKRLRGKPVRAWEWLNAVRRHQPRLFAHWHLLPSTRSRPVGAV